MNFNTWKLFYTWGYCTKEQLIQAVGYNQITIAQYQEITGQEYPIPPAAKPKPAPVPAPAPAPRKEDPTPAPAPKEAPKEDPKEDPTPVAALMAEEPADQYKNYNVIIKG